MTVNPTQIATTLGRPTPAASSATFKQWTLWINDARLLIKSRLGDLNALDQDDLDYVVREAVAQRARNTRDDGTTSKTVTIDDGTVTKRWEDGTSNQIEITDDWWDLLSPNHVDHGAFTIRPYARHRHGCWPAEI